MTREELETIISFSYGEKEVSVYTADPAMIRKFDNMCKEYPNDYRHIKTDTMDGEIISKEYVINRKRLKFQKPMEITEERKEKLLTALEKYRSIKNAEKQNSKKKGR